jgi:hypothetical protein
VPKVKDFCHLKIKKDEADMTTILGTLVILAHFSHFFLGCYLKVTIAGSDNARSVACEEPLLKRAAPLMSKKSTLR